MILAFTCNSINMMVYWFQLVLLSYILVDTSYLVYSISSKKWTFEPYLSLYPFMCYNVTMLQCYNVTMVEVKWEK
jgi:DMSO/TMAO reductase YedYZ heme-binding membrane subunit